MRHCIVGCLIGLALLASPALADTLRVAAAGSLTEVFTDRYHLGALLRIRTPAFDVWKLGLHERHSDYSGWTTDQI
jgi:hypothetical protein